MSSAGEILVAIQTGDRLWCQLTTGHPRFTGKRYWELFWAYPPVGTGGGPITNRDTCTLTIQNEGIVTASTDVMRIQVANGTPEFRRYVGMWASDGNWTECPPSSLVAKDELLTRITVNAPMASEDESPSDNSGLRFLQLFTPHVDRRILQLSL